MPVPVFRFAPSPNGALHLGHAYSALLNNNFAQATGGRLLLRMEDIDTARCTPTFEAGIFEDLAWLGIGWEQPVRRQSEHFALYREALDRLVAEELVYPAFMSRGEIRAFIAEREAGGARWPRDPDGVPLYPAADSDLSQRRQRALMAEVKPFAWRLDMERAFAACGEDAGWTEARDAALGEAAAETVDPRLWGDVIVARRDVPTSYHLSVVVDDALQEVTHVVRGRDLHAATGIHRVLQKALGYPAPVYHHHALILAPDGRKLSKSQGDTALAALRESSVSPQEVRERVGLG